MPRRRPQGVLELFWACLSCAASGRREHVPTSEDYPDDVVRRISFDAGGGHPWRLSALVSPRERPAPWKIVVITGAPSWAEYWAPTIAALPQDREMIVVDRPGYACSEPHDVVPDIAVQAEALAPLLHVAPGQRLMLVGQSYGAAIATLMAAANPSVVSSLVLLSSYLGEPGPTARWLLDLGARALPLIPSDLRNAVIEVSGQPAQLPRMRAALERLTMPVHVLHGDADDFAPLALAQALASEARLHLPPRFEAVAGANHFLNDGPAETLVELLQLCVPDDPPPRAAKPSWLAQLSGWAGDLAAHARRWRLPVLTPAGGLSSG